MAVKNGEGFWMSPRGKAVDPEVISPLDKRRDRTVEQIVKAAARLENRMRVDKEKYLQKIDKYMSYIEKKFHAERTGKGNLVLTNYSGTVQVEVKISDVIVFDEKLQIAKTMIDACLKKWGADANKNYRAVVDQAFEVDKTGQVNKYNIIRLMRLNIKDEGWKNAMAVLQKSQNITATRQYLNIKKRADLNSKWESINLNFSSM